MNPFDTRYAGSTELSTTIATFIGRLSDVVLSLPMEEEQRTLLEMTFNEASMALHMMGDLSVINAQMIESLAHELERLKEAQKEVQAVKTPKENR